MKKIGILCLSAIPDDPRVRRQADLLFAAGYDVVAVGLPGARSPRPSWKYIHIDQLSNATSEKVNGDEKAAKYGSLDNASNIAGKSISTSLGNATTIQQKDAVTKQRSAAWLQKARYLHARLGRPIRIIYLLHNLIIKAAYYFRHLLRSIFTTVLRNLNVFQSYLSKGRTGRFSHLLYLQITPNYADELFWKLNDRFEKLFLLANSQDVDLWIANDWTTLPIASRLQKTRGIPFCYDTHELAVDEYAQDFKWRLTQRPIISKIEKNGIKNASFVSCVSAGISKRLEELYKLSSPPLVVRNMPIYTKSTFRETGTYIRVLYHGIVSPGRALEEIIKSVSSWRDEFSLTIRGPSNPDYLLELQRLAEKEGVKQRIHFDPPVAMVSLVEAARPFDVGIFAIRGHSEQNKHVLPNKFFEYCMSGLALCVSDLPEMTALVQRYSLGVTIRNPEPIDISRAINQLDRNSIDQFKKNSILAAEDLCWENESTSFLAAIEEVIKKGLKCDFRCDRRTS